MQRRSILLRRIGPALAILGGILLLTAACSSSSSPAVTPTIDYLTPTPGSSPTPTTAPAETASPSATTSGTASATASASATSSAETTIHLVAKDIKFNLSTITVPAGAKITVDLLNEDSVPHNFAVYTKSGGTSLYTGPLVTGPNKSVQDTFTAPTTPGNYYFQCDVHPTLMNGTLIVK